MTVILREEDFARAVDSMPMLSGIGINSVAVLKRMKNIPHEEAVAEYLADRRSLMDGFGEFEICCRWLERFRKVKKPQVRSLYLKHAVELLEGQFVSNGALIAAVAHLGLEWRQAGDDSPDIEVAVSRQCPHLKKVNHLVELLLRSR